MLGKGSVNGLFLLLVKAVACACALATMCAGTCYGAGQKHQDERTRGAENKWSYMVLPRLNNTQRLELAIDAKKNRHKYLTEANDKIQAFSEGLEEYTRLWLAGRAKAKFPKGFLPPYMDGEKTRDWELVRPGAIDPTEQWYAMRAYDPRKELHQFSPDPHVTYLKLIFVAPLGARLLIEGDFPHARFMDYQILTPVDPMHPVTGQMGICEVPIVDVDIEPDPGHVNPFRPGADRGAKKRHYHLTFQLEAGNAVDLNPWAMQAPAYRGPGNRRVGGPFAFTGPYGGNVLVPSIVWLRYYAPDKGVGPLGGVPLPKAALQLPSGEKFWITCDKSVAVKLQTKPVPAQSTPPMEPYPFLGPGFGWFKMFGIMRLHAESRAYYKSKPWGSLDPAEEKRRIRRIFSTVFNQGADATPPGNHENFATECNYISYLVRPMNLGRDKVIVLKGKLPVYPKTRNGEKEMTGGQVRYFSITHQTAMKGYMSTPYGSLMDDEIVVDGNNEYVIVYSREEERPANAREEYGVTWEAWGGPAHQTMVVRWMSVMPDWYSPEYSPGKQNLPIEKACWSEPGYDQHLVGRNRPGALGPYHPVIHYMTRRQFESLGKKRIVPGDIPEWESSAGDTLPKKEDVDVQQKIVELQQAFRDLKGARSKGDRKGVAESAKRIRETWDVLPKTVRLEIEKKRPGITEKIERIR